MTGELFRITHPDQAQATTGIGMIHALLETGAMNDNAYSATEITVSPQQGVPIHRHAPLESFYVLEGTFEFHVADQVAIGHAGDFVTITPGVFHGWKNIGTGLGRVLCLVIPGGMEEMFVEGGHPVTDHSAPPLAPTPEDLQRAVAAARKYGVESREPEV